MKRDVAKAWRWFTAEDALRWALASYYQACREIEPPADDPEPDQWSSQGYFVFLFHVALTRRLCREASERNIPCDHGSATEDLHWSGADFLRLQGNSLHPAENAVDNPCPAGVENG